MQHRPLQLRVLLLGINYRPEPVGIAVYSEGLARWLTERGHSVEVVTGQPYYPAWRIPREYRTPLPKRTVEDRVGVTRVPLYVPREPSGAKRILHHVSFMLSAALPTLAGLPRFRPHLVFVVAPSLVSALLGWVAARLSGASAWLHVQDFEVDAALSTSFLTEGRLGTRLALAFERWILRRFDRVSSISPMMCARLAAKGVASDRVVELRNWASLDAVEPLSAPSTYRAKWNIATQHVALYAGNLGAKQGLHGLIDAARRLAHREDLTFVICGEGPERQELEGLAAGLPHVQFRELQPLEMLGQLLGLASIHLLPQVGRGRPRAALQAHQYPRL